jgi:opacity protein-like surface antigen
LYYNLLTDWHNASAAPYMGYQNYVDRTDVNGGTDLGYKVTFDLAVTLGYRYGYQYQQALPHSIDTLQVNGQQAQSSSDYQRILLGIEGKPVKWLNVKLVGGPDFRSYNDAAPVNDDHPVTRYCEGLITATITPNQNLTFTTKQWQWVSSTGKLPYFDSSYALNYHWKATSKLGLDLGGKFLEADYDCGSPTKSLNQSLRNDAEYIVSVGVGYAFTPHLSASLAYEYDFGRNLQNLPASLASSAAYRQFNNQLVTLGMLYKF